MWEANRERIEKLAGDGLVLDIGGWANPLHRADYVMDVFPYETRYLGYHGVGLLPSSVMYPSPREGERFTKDRWVLHDICSRKPFPFPDKMFDFVVCSHTLEDIRDPIWACSEIVRISKAGYIETPSRLWEQTKRGSGVVGEGHHRWMVEVQDNRILFYGKPHFLHTSRKFFVPYSFVEREKSEIDKVVWLFWNDSFLFEEPPTFWNSEVADYIRELNIPRKYYAIDNLRALRQQWWRLEGTFLRLAKRGPKPSLHQDCWTWDKLFEANAKLMAQGSGE